MVIIRKCQFNVKINQPQNEISYAIEQPLIMFCFLFFFPPIETHLTMSANGVLPVQWFQLICRKAFAFVCRKNGMRQWKIPQRDFVCRNCHFDNVSDVRWHKQNIQIRFARLTTIKLGFRITFFLWWKMQIHRLQTISEELRLWFTK